MRLLRVAGSLLLVATLGLPAHAHERVLLDADDSDGPLDIVAATFDHDERGYVARLVTYEGWTDDTISEELDYVRFDFGRKKELARRCVLVHLHQPEGEGPIAVGGGVYEDCWHPLPYNERIGDVGGAVRPDAHSIEVLIDPDDLWERARRFKWRALTSFEEEADPHCPPPEDRPPEHFYGTCTDETAWGSHRFR